MDRSEIYGLKRKVVGNSLLVFYLRHLYMARQSYKVKIFGKPTAGAFDFSNLNIVDFPNGRYILRLATSVVSQYPEYKVDDIGIQPDFYIGDDISIEDRVAYVQSVIEND